MLFWLLDKVTIMQQCARKCENYENFVSFYLEVDPVLQFISPHMAIWSQKH